ncbi:ATP-dependent zinc protease family protein [Microlunatus sp. Y2014]|uniref:ATP-dependent zinc protease family protein n=1 Tax=Microlunatus sp. Y2014 TaxID=3418488 RepID=UPI003DA76464
MSGPSPSYLTAGWREWVALPGLGVPWVKAKLDTGARSSSIHAFDLEEFEREGGDWVRFAIHPWQRSAEDTTVVELPVHDRRLVRSSSGHSDRRVVVRTEIELLGTSVQAELTLTRRDQMGFRMLIGREALRGRFLVDPGRSYLGGRPRRATRRRNRGR